MSGGNIEKYGFSDSQPWGLTYIFWLLVLALSQLSF
jgi:hypothetical protein